HSGKAMPFRRSSIRGEAAPRFGGVASSAGWGSRDGKAEPYRSVLRQSRKNNLSGAPVAFMRRFSGLLIVYTILLLLFFSLTHWSLSVHSRSLHSQEGFEMPVQERARVRAPELSGGRGWLNTDKPLSLAALKGKVVLLDFWTYGCINCMHIIPDLKKLEKKYPNELVVI